MKVYVITKGEYSDYHICGVALDETRAEMLAKRFSNEWSNAEVEEYDTEDYKEIIRYSNTYYCVYDIETKSFVRIDSSDFIDVSCQVYEMMNGNLGVYVYADNETQALKFANDKISKYKAEQLGL